MMLGIILLVLGVLTRFVQHEPNFTPVTALALLGGVYLSRRYAILLPLSMMMISDIFIGLHETIIFTWGSFILIALIGIAIKNHKNITTVFISSVVSAIIFFTITNFGVWFTGQHAQAQWYAPTFQGLTDCYIAAIPFFKNTLFSSVFYSAVFFGTYELIAYWVKGTRFARVLLTT